MKTKSLLNIGKFMRILKVSLLHNWNMYLDARLDISICIFIPKLTTFQKMLSLIFREARIFRQKIWILQSVSTLYAKPWYSRKLLTATGNIKITISMLQTEKKSSGQIGICERYISHFFMNCFSTIESLITFAHLSFGICWMPLIKYLKNSFWEELNKFETFEITMTKSQLGTASDISCMSAISFRYSYLISHSQRRNCLWRCFIS